MVLDKLRGTESYDIDTQSIKDATDTIAFYEMSLLIMYLLAILQAPVVLYNRKQTNTRRYRKRVLTLIHKTRVLLPAKSIQTLKMRFCSLLQAAISTISDPI